MPSGSTSFRDDQSRHDQCRIAERSIRSHGTIRQAVGGERTPGNQGRSQGAECDLNLVAHHLRPQTTRPGFDSAKAPSAFWVKLDAFSFSAVQPVKQLKASGGRTYSGDVSKQCVPAKPLAFLPGTPQKLIPIALESKHHGLF